MNINQKNLQKLDDLTQSHKLYLVTSRNQITSVKGSLTKDFGHQAVVIFSADLQSFLSHSLNMPFPITRSSIAFLNKKVLLLS